MKIAIITGASSGLGSEYVKAVLESRPELDEIWVMARRAQRLEELKQNISDKIRPVPLDITDAEALSSLSDMLLREDAEIALLINNAGFGKHGLFADISVGDNGGMVRLNCEALTVVTAICLPFMNSGAEIINSCSIASFAPNTRMAVYCSTKAYVMSLSRALRSELKPRKINVLAVCPGPMETEFLGVAGISKGTSGAFDRLPRVSPPSIARRSLKASKNGRAVYTDRVFYKFYRFVAKILPTSLVMKMAAT